MCNLYRALPSASEIIRLFNPGLVADRTGNAPWPEDVYPDRMAPIIRQGGRHPRSGAVEVGDAVAGLGLEDGT